MRLLSLNGVALSALGLIACATTTAESRAPLPDAQDVQLVDDQASTELREHHRHHHRGGVMQFIAMSLDTLAPEDAKQPQVERIQGELYTCMAASGAIEKTLHLLVADGIAAGAVDEGRVEATIERLDGAAAGVRDCGIDALNKLHSILSPTERAELVEKVQAHWDVWRQVNHDEEATGRGRGGRLADLARELTLTPEQVGRISAALQAARAGRHDEFDRARVEGHIQAFAAAFAQSSFDARSIAANENGRLATAGARRMATFYETVTPLLTREQRATLAEHLREHARQQPAMSAN
jgi:Spy/CpxP family protein refolding chaperone